MEKMVQRSQSMNDSHALPAAGLYQMYAACGCPAAAYWNNSCN